MKVVLVIADDHALCEALCAALPETDLPLIVNTLEDATRQLISTRADAAIIDDSPALGLKALQRMRDAAPEIPVVMLCAYDDAETRAGYTLAGARACLPKPFSCQTLQDAIEQVAARPKGSPPPPAKPVAGISPAAALSQHQTALRWLSRTSSYIRDPARLSESLVHAATDVFDAVRSAVLLEAEGTVRVAAGHGIPTGVAGSLRLSFATGLMRWLEANHCLFDSFASCDGPDAVKQMRVLGARLAVPLVSGGRVCGAFLIGEKASGLDYTAEERDLLTAIGRCASIALENAVLYQDISWRQGRLDAILANISAGVVVVLPNKTVSMMNQSAERILQLRAVDVLGRSIQKLGSAFADVVLRALADEKPHLRRQIRDPAIDAQLGLSVTPLGSDGVVAIFSKLPEETVATEDIAYSPFWEYLATRVAQEIKNPMVAVNTFAQLLPRKYDSQDFRETFTEVVQKEVVRINNVVETLFEFARHPRLTLKRACVNDTVRNVLCSFEDALKARVIELETEWDPELPDVDLDLIFFSKAVKNVVQNSIEAMPSGGKLKVTTRKQEDHCELVIADTGPGIPERDSSQIFMPFFSTKEQGMGLGLAVATRIMKQHNGDLRLVANPEGGGAFAFSLPSMRKSYADDTSD